MVKQFDNKIENIDLNLAVRIIRDDIGYKKGQCLDENMRMAAFLKKMNVLCTFKLGEAVYAHNIGGLSIAHRDFRVGMTKDQSPPFHCWLDVGGNVLDISIGSWSLNLNGIVEEEYVYGEYNHGYTLGEKFGLEEEKVISKMPTCYSYRPFDTFWQALTACWDAEFLHTNRTMYRDLDLNDKFKKSIYRYEKKYKDATRDSEYRVFDNA